MNKKAGLKSQINKISASNCVSNIKATLGIKP